jgi:uncharacterized protein (TIGR03435 family)
MMSKPMCAKSYSCGRLLAGSLPVILSLAFAVPALPVLAQAAAQAGGAQSVEAADAVGPPFEVATIRPTQNDGSGGGWMGFRLAPSGRLMVRSMPLASLVGFAYLPKPGTGRVQGGPKWAGSDRYDIEAKVDDAQMVGWDKLSDAERTDRVRPMMRALLSERFHLKLHTEMQPTPVYVLVQAKGGARMKEVPTPAPMEGEGDGLEKVMRQMTEHPGQPVPGQIMCTAGGCTGTAVQMSSAIGQISGSSRADRIVIDQTGLKGYYNFSFTQPRYNDDSAMAEIEDDLGLKFEPRTMPMKTYVIDSAEKPSLDGAEVQQPAKN